MVEVGESALRMGVGNHVPEEGLNGAIRNPCRWLGRGKGGNTIRRTGVRRADVHGVWEDVLTVPRVLRNVLARGARLQAQATSTNDLFKHHREERKAESGKRKATISKRLCTQFCMVQTMVPKRLEGLLGH